MAGVGIVPRSYTPQFYRNEQGRLVSGRPPSPQEQLDRQYISSKGNLGLAGSLGPSDAAIAKVRAMGGPALSMNPVSAGPTPEQLRQQQLEDERRRRAWQVADRSKLLAYIDKQGTPPTVAPPSLDTGREADARAAAFARAKDQAGRLARASLTSIAEEMAGRGISGSGIEALRAAGGIGEAAEPIQELTRTQALSDAARAANISDLTYQGGITQRGQDLANRQSYLALLRGLY